MASEETRTDTNTTVSQPASPAVRATADKLAGGISAAYDRGPQVFQESLYSPAGATTQDAWAKALAAAGNPLYGQGVNSGMSFANNLISSGGLNATQRGLDSKYADLYGAYDQEAPGYATLRSNLMNDAVKNVGEGFTNSGRFGGGSYVDAATKSAVDAVAPLDYQNFQNGINNKLGVLGARNGLQQQGIGNAFAATSALPGLFSAAQLPATTIGAVGAAQDANQQGILQGRADLHERNANGWTDLIAKLTSAAAGNAAGSGTSTVSTQTTPQTPWWQSVLGLGIQAL